MALGCGIFKIKFIIEKWHPMATIHVCMPVFNKGKSQRSISGRKNFIFSQNVGTFHYARSQQMWTKPMSAKLNWVDFCVLNTAVYFIQYLEHEMFTIHTTENYSIFLHSFFLVLFFFFSLPRFRHNNNVFYWGRNFEKPKGSQHGYGAVTAARITNNHEKYGQFVPTEKCHHLHAGHCSFPLDYVLSLVLLTVSIIVVIIIIIYIHI